MSDLFPLSPHASALYAKFLAFIEAEQFDAVERRIVADYAARSGASRFSLGIHSEIERLKAAAQAAGLWNLWIPADLPHGARLSNAEYALFAEQTGKWLMAAEVFNCSAPDTGNMEVLLRYASPAQQRQWLDPLLRGDIRSCFAMTEPAVASSDATNIQCQVRRERDHYVINGTKWWTSGAGDPRCRIMILMGRVVSGDDSTAPAAEAHKQQSMILVPMDTPGITVVRALSVFGYDDAPHGHCEVQLRDVRVPLSNVILGEGRGFEIAQGRLGPGRLHHCMRAIGVASRCLDAHVDRALSRVAFGKRLAEQGKVRHDIAESRRDIEQARLLTLAAAAALDKSGSQGARDKLALVKFAVPQLALAVIDRAIQLHGGAGVSQDFPLAYAYASVRTLRIADGPDEVHARTIALFELKRRSNKL